MHTSSFVNALNKFFRWIGIMVADRPSVVICIVMLATVIFSTKFALTGIEDHSTTGFSPSDVRAFKEIEAYKNFNSGHEPIWTFILILARDGGSMNRIEHLNATVEIIQQINHQFAVKDITFAQICEKFCDINEAVVQYRNALIIKSAAVENGELLTDSITNLSYPISNSLGFDYDLTMHFFGVETYRESEMSNKTLSNIKHLQMVLLMFRAEQPDQWDDTDVRRWDRSISNFYLNGYNNSFIRPLIYSLSYAQDEIVRVGTTLQPYSIIGFIFITVFSIITVYINLRQANQWSIHKIIYAISAAICPLTATTTSLGILFCLGVGHGIIIGITPFLVLAIGVDDCYLLINSWKNIQSKMQRTCFSVDSYRENIVKILLDVGPSITITTLTNVIAFGIGIFSNIPDIRLLSLSCSFAIAFSYLYTLTIYLATLCLCIKYEMKREDNQKNTMSMITASGKTARWVENYCVWLSKPLTNCSLLIILLAYWCVSVYGILNVKPDLADNKFFLKDSSLLEAITYREQYILPKYTSVTIFVSEPGNMGDKLRRNQLEKMMSEFESLPECNGAQFSRFWIRDYEKFIQASEMDEDDEQASDQLKMFVDWPEYSYWGGFMRFDNDTGELVSFFSTVAYHGEDLWQPTRRTALLNQWRAIADNYSEFSVTIYEDEAPDLDALDTLVTSTFKNSFITLLCMALVVLVFMASISSLLITLISVTSICSGVFGLVSLWGIDIDAFSMTALVISIGLSVDFPAHVIYHYYRTEDSKSLSTFKHRMQYTISSIGFPLFQCSGSSVLFVGCLLFIPCYLSEVFLKTIFLVITLGIIHALVFIPLFLAIWSNVRLHFCSIPKSQKSNQPTVITISADVPVSK